MKPQQVNATLDARGMLCPMPVVKTAKAIQSIGPGEVLEVLATDRGSKVDIPAWCAARSHTLLHAEEVENQFRYYIQKGT